MDSADFRARDTRAGRASLKDAKRGIRGKKGCSMQPFSLPTLSLLFRQCRFDAWSRADLHAEFILLILTQYGQRGLLARL
jgi:hypothetical protein